MDLQSYPQYLAILDLNETLDKNKTVYEKKYSFTDEQRNSVFTSSNTAFYIEENVFLLTKAPERSGKIEDNKKLLCYRLAIYTSSISIV